MPSARRLLFWVCLGLTIGCSDAAPAGHGDPVASTMVVENAAALLPAESAWRVVDPPLLTIGAADGVERHYLFHRVVAAARLSDDRLVVANGGTLELRFFDGLGRYLGAAGRSGGGPGEFGSLTGMSVIGDSLFVYDRRHSRVSVFDGNGEYARSFSIAPQNQSQPLDLVGVFPDASWAVAVPDPVDADSGVVRSDVLYLRVRAGGDAADTLGRFPGPERVVITRRTGSTVSSASANLPFGSEPTAAVAGDLFVYGNPDRYQIHYLRRDGQPERVLRRSHDPAPLTAADMRLLEEMDRQAAGRAPMLLTDLPLPRHKPAFGPFLHERAGNLWVSEFSWPQRWGTTWSVFDPQGRWLTDVEMPLRFRPLEVGSDYLLGVFTDELGVEYLRMYGLEKD